MTSAAPSTASMNSAEAIRTVGVLWTSTGLAGSAGPDTSPRRRGVDAITDAILAAEGDVRARECGRDVVGLLRLSTVEIAGELLHLLDMPLDRLSPPDRSAALAAIDAAMFVLPPAGAPDPLIAATWESCTETGIPMIIVIADIDDPAADTEDVIESCQESLHPVHALAAIQMPVLSDDDTVIGLMDFLDQQIIDFSSGAPLYRPPDLEHALVIGDDREHLIQAIVTLSDDDTLVEHMMLGDVTDHVALRHAMLASTASGALHPILMCAAQPPGLGGSTLTEFLRQALMRPAGTRLPLVSTVDGDPESPLIGDAQGRLCGLVLAACGPDEESPESRALVRLFSGTLAPRHDVALVRRPTDGSGSRGVRLDSGRLIALDGAPLDPMETPAQPGDILVIAGLSDAQVGDTVTDIDHPIAIVL